MTAGIFARVPKVAALAVVVLLATATLTLAATSTVSTPPAAKPAAAAAPRVLVVPDVRRQAYVFAKGTLEQAGFAWRVEGSVKGYAANVVASQSPAAGARVIADGTPLVVLQLSRNATYGQEGLPENDSPYAGTPARLVGSKPARPARTVAAAKPKAAALPKKAAKPAAKPAVEKAKQAERRKPAFAVPGAPAEPLDEIPLAERAQRLDTWLDSHRQRSRRAVGHWLYQHNWIVVGARFGWADGDEALRRLIEVDRRVQKLWGIGGRSEKVARRALAEVERRSR